MSIKYIIKGKLIKKRESVDWVRRMTGQSSIILEQIKVAWMQIAKRFNKMLLDLFLFLSIIINECRKKGIHERTERNIFRTQNIFRTGKEKSRTRRQSEPASLDANNKVNWLGRFSRTVLHKLMIIIISWGNLFEIWRWVDPY